MKHGKIELELDEFTPCLRRLSDNVLVQTASQRLASLPNNEDFSVWEFDWHKPFADGL